MKVFISQPMNGLSDKHVKAVRANARAKILETFPDAQFYSNYEAFDPDPNGPEITHTGLWYLGSAFKVMSQADAVYFCQDWEKYRGCRIEYEAALMYGLTIMEEDRVKRESSAFKNQAIVWTK